MASHLIVDNIVGLGGYAIAKPYQDKAQENNRLPMHIPSQSYKDRDINRHAKPSQSLCHILLAIAIECLSLNGFLSITYKALPWRGVPGL